MDRIDDAIRDLENAISKCTTFAPSHVQKSFAGKYVDQSWYPSSGIIGSLHDHLFPSRKIVEEK